MERLGFGIRKRETRAALLNVRGERTERLIGLEIESTSEVGVVKGEVIVPLRIRTKYWIVPQGGKIDGSALDGGQVN